MSDYLIIDAHVHTYKTAEIGMQAMAGAGQAGCNGTPEELLSILHEAEISKAVQVNMTPAREMYEAAIGKIPEADREEAHSEIAEKMSARLQRRNTWTCSLSDEHEEFVAYPSVDPIMGSDEAVAEVERCSRELGAGGIKLHPAEGHYFPYDERMRPVYAKAQELGLPIISHGGLFMMSPDVAYTQPSNFEPVLKDFPDLTLVIAHLGHGFWEESIEIARKYPNAYFDTSAVISGMVHIEVLSDEALVELIRDLGVDRVMFGSDYPWFSPATSLKHLLRLSLIPAEKEKILGGNAQRVLRI